MEKRKEIEVTPKMIEAGLEAFDRWASRYGVDDTPAATELVKGIVRCALFQSR